MSYNYRKKSSTYKKGYPIINQTKESRPRKIFNVDAYIKEEFFNADELVFTQISNLYKQLYGYSAYKYLIDTYNSWKTGNVGLSGQTQRRILECVPRFLSDEKKFYILKCEIIYFVDNLHFKQLNKKISLNQLNKLFENYSKEIDNFNQINLSWFVVKKIFSETEIQQFLNVCKYALNLKLNLSFRQVESDLRLIKLKFCNFKQVTLNASYKIDFLISTVNLSDINQTSLDFIQLNKFEIKIEGIYKQFAEKYILDELMHMSFSEKEGEVNQFIKAKDLDFIINQYEKFLAIDSEATIKSEFKGEGGTLNLSIEFKSIKKIKAALLLSKVKLTFKFIFLICPFILIIVLKIYGLFILLVIVGFIIGGLLLDYIKNELNVIKNLKLDLKKYGK